MTLDFDTVVVGAGVIGLAIARELSFAGQTVLVIERAPRAGTETSSRNSEVIHAGIYYPKGSLKSRLCVEGNQLLYSYCASSGVAHKRLGKLIVATSLAEEVKLGVIKQQADVNGVADLQWLSKEQVCELEPEVLCTKALFSPSTGIVDAVGFMTALRGEAELLGANFSFNTTFMSATQHKNIFTITASDLSGETVDISSRQLINCAGHGAHQVAASVAGIDATRLPPQYFAKGSYCNASGKSPFTHLIYPVPVSGALGIHATLDLAGAVRFGPDIQWNDAVDYSTPPGLPEALSAAVVHYWPHVMDRKLSPAYCGVRPKIHGPGSGFADFCVQTKAQHGVDGLVNLFGIESPGLTASLALSKFVANHLEKAGPT